MKEELKQCPFCGGKAALKQNDDGTNFYVDCSLEKVSCAVIPRTWDYDTEEEATTAWNNRV